MRDCLARSPHTLCSGSVQGGGWGQQWDDHLTRKLLSLGLVVRLRPRRMLSFLSDTLDRVTLPGAEERHSTYSHFCLSAAQSLLQWVT